MTKTNDHVQTGCPQLTCYHSSSTFQIIKDTTAVHLFTHHVIMKPSSQINQPRYDGYFLGNMNNKNMYTATVQFAVMVVKSPWGTFSKSAYFHVVPFLR